MADRLRPFGWSNSLSAKLIQLTAPGVPDVYQGTELWDLSLVDPDNRRPVDYRRRVELLRQDRRRLAARRSTTRAPPSCWSPAGRCGCAGTGRSCSPATPPLAAAGAAADHVFAFDRGGAVAVATRLPAGLAASGGWRDTSLDLPPGTWTDRAHRSSVHRRCHAAVGELLGPVPGGTAGAGCLTRLGRDTQTTTSEAIDDRNSTGVGATGLEGAVGGRRRRPPDGRAGRRLVDGRPGRTGGPDGSGAAAVDDGRDRLRLPAGRRPTVVRPDPRSRRQPDGVDGADPHLRPGGLSWGDAAWTGRRLGRQPDLRDARRHLHPGGHPRRRRRQARPPGVDRRRHGGGVAGQRLQRRPQLGLRRRPVVRRAGELRRAAGLPAVRRRLPPARHRRHPGRRLQPPRRRRQPPPEFRAVPERHRQQQHLGRHDQPGRRRFRRGPAVHPGQRADVAAGLPRRRPAARCRARAGRQPGQRTCWRRSPIEVDALAPHVRPAADADRRVRPQRPEVDHPAGGRRLRPDGAVERRFPPRPARRADRRDRRLLRRFRADVGYRQGAHQGVLPRRHLLQLPRPRARPAGGHPGHAELALRRLRAGSRPDRQPGHRRPADGAAVASPIWPSPRCWC